MAAQPRTPPVWTREQLDGGREIAQRLSARARRGEGSDAFYEARRDAERDVRQTLALTDYLLSLSAESFIRSVELWQTLRYFCAPPISEEDLWTQVGRKFKRVGPDTATAVAEAFSALFDKERFPWVDAARTPLPAEIERAVAATGTLLAYERLKTHKRKASSQAQEDTISRTLQSAGWYQDPSRGALANLDEMQRGTFSRERKLAGVKCDIPVRLHDGRLLALECKVSNGPKNSWKRLCREVGGKAEAWRTAFGSRVLTAAVLSGVYDLKNLVTAQQDQGVFIFWEHELEPLTRFVNETR